MSTRRDWLLQQMGITQYVLRRPRALQGEVALSLPAHTRLVIIAETPPSPEEPLVSDVLRALAIAPQDTVGLTPDQLAMLPNDYRCASWRLGTDMPLTLAGAKLATPALDELYHNASAKRALWQQICDYESDFFTHTERS